MLRLTEPRSVRAGTLPLPGWFFLDKIFGGRKVKFDMEKTMPPFDNLWNAVTAWAEEQSAQITATGKPLSQHEIAIAKKVGVLAPEKIRVLLVPNIPFPEDPTIRTIGEQVGLVSEKTGGMTLCYGIFMRDDQKERSDIWPHEFRHVAQYECFGSIRNFMFFYLKELLHFRYGLGPLEVDAKKAEEIVQAN